MHEASRTLSSLTRQTFLPGFCPVEDALKFLSQAEAEARGAIFTRREVVEFILDLVGYVADQPLWDLSLLEPSFGDGDFLLVAVERLLEARRHQTRPVPIQNLASCIRAVELHRATFESTCVKLVRQLRDTGISRTDAMMLTSQWLIHDDFLLTELPSEFTFIVGNPPYIRQELIPKALIAEYRARYRTIFDRADIYIPFIERSVKQLSADGKVGIICADRWMKNRYGGPLRQLLSEQFHLSVYVDMINTPAFHSDVIAYPAIFVIERKKVGPTRIARRPEISKPALTSLARQLMDHKKPDIDRPITELAKITNGAQPWILEPSVQLNLVRRLERDVPSIEESGCKIRIGVATGADEAFIGRYDELDVENDRKLPLATTRDILSGEIRWQGLGVINPFADTGKLVDLAHYPRLRRYLEDRRDKIAMRYIARKTPVNWYRTIDRIYPALAATPKLLIPDIKGEVHIVYEEGHLYPHHNLYFVTSRDWDLHALRAILLSGIAKLFVATYSTRMRGGYLRFQAQYLRRIRLPHWSNVSHDMMNALIDSANIGDMETCNQIVFNMYNLNAEERAVLSGDGTENRLGEAQ